MSKFFLLPLLSFLVLQNCSRENADQQDSKNLLYEAEEVNFADDIPFNVKQVVCKADSGSINISIELQNRTNGLIDISTLDWELETGEGMHSSTISAAKSFKIDGNATATMDLQFMPTNSMKLFRLTGLKGNPLPSYKLTYKRENKIDLVSSKSGYDLYLKDKKEPDVFLLTVDAGFKKDELQYLQSHLNLEHHGVEIHDQEILTDGLNISLNAYQINDTLIVKLKLINHSLFPVGIIPDSMKIQLDSKQLVSFAPHKIREVTIPRSQRGYIEKHYVIGNSEADQFLLNLSSLVFISPEPVPVFYCKSILMKRSSLN